MSAHTGDDIELLRSSPAVDSVLDRPAIAVFAGPGGDGTPLTAWDATATTLATLHGLWLVGFVGVSRRREIGA